METFSVTTNARCEFVDITSEVAALIGNSNVASGIVTIFCPHTTAGITINENADPDVTRDLVLKTSKIIDPNDPDYRHGEGNSDSHLKSSLYGASETVIIEDGRMQLGTWQSVYFVEFDGPRTRKVNVKVISG